MIKVIEIKGGVPIVESVAKLVNNIQGTLGKDALLSASDLFDLLGDIATAQAGHHGGIVGLILVRFELGALHLEGIFIGLSHREELLLEIFLYVAIFCLASSALGVMSVSEAWVLSMR